jgi:predicted Ser/Thr protein kinase
MDFLERFVKFLNEQHLETKKYLQDINFKNLIVAFTTDTEWKNEGFSPEVQDFIEGIKHHNLNKNGGYKM